MAYQTPFLRSFSESAVLKSLSFRFPSCDLRMNKPSAIEKVSFARKVLNSLYVSGKCYSEEHVLLLRYCIKSICNFDSHNGNVVGNTVLPKVISEKQLNPVKSDKDSTDFSAESKHP